jgi:hypothetical protein
MPRLVAFEHVVQHAGPACLGQELRVKADQGARRYEVLLSHPAGAVVDHVFEPPLPQRQELCDHAEIVLGDIDRQSLHRLAELSIHELSHHPRLANGELEPFATHCLDEDCQL